MIDLFCDKCKELTWHVDMQCKECGYKHHPFEVDNKPLTVAIRNALKDIKCSKPTWWK